MATDAMNNFINDAVLELAKRTDEAKEAYLRALFSYVEQDDLQIDQYVIEDHGFKLEKDGTGFVLRTDIVVRPKRRNELDYM